MKKLALLSILALSFSAMAYETENSTSYSGPDNGTVFGSTQLSGTSEIALREQVVVNQTAVAAFLQSNEVNASSLEISEIAELSRKALHEKVELMSDREAITEALGK